MATVIFTYEGTPIKVQCLKEDKMKDICHKYISKINMNLNSIYFLYGGNQINLELTFNEQANEMDKGRKEMNILVYKNEEEERFKCPKCGETLNLDILDNIIKNNQNDLLKEIKSQIENIINLNDIIKIKNQIKLIKYALDNIIIENEKNINIIKNITNNKNKDYINKKIIEKYNNKDNLIKGKIEIDDDNKDINEFLSKDKNNINSNNVLNKNPKKQTEKKDDNESDFTNWNPFNILILGLDNAGKTTLLLYLVGKNNKNTKPTFGVYSERFQYEGNEIQFYDLGGIKTIRQYWKYYYEKVDGIIYVLDINDKKRLEESNEVIQVLLKEERLLNVPILFYGNKCDLTKGLDKDEINKKLKFYDIKGRDWSLYFCSALKGAGIRDGMKWLLNYLNSNGK